MPDPLTPEERAAIAAYTGPIRVIPRGVSGIPPEDVGKGTDYRKQGQMMWAEAMRLYRARARYEKRNQTGA
jgi:hypothetical protein